MFTFIGFFIGQFMNIDTKYHKVTSYLFTQFPQYQQIGAGAYKSGLEGMVALDELMEQPHKRFHSIHVAGTNGKGSVAHLLAAILQRAGYKVGLYTSPHLVDFRERIRINGVMIPQEEVVRFVERFKESLDVLQPSFFEITTAMAFHHFARQRVDIAVIETGLGGRLDSTNVINPVLSIITNIGFDHCTYLGDSLPLIAAEKGGIIKPGVPVVVGERNPNTDEVFIQMARGVKSLLFFAQDYYKVESAIHDEHYQRFYVNENGLIWSEEYLLDLGGDYQRQNLPTVLMGTELLRRMGKIFGRHTLSQNVIKFGLRDAARTTGLRGRWECISQKPKVIVDTAHNAHGLQWVFEQLQRECKGALQGVHHEPSEHTHCRLHIVFGVVAEKDLEPILLLLPQDAHYYFTQPQIHRALNANLLAEQCRSVGIIGEVIPNVAAALTAAKRNAHKDDIIFVGGSTFVVSEVV